MESLTNLGWVGVASYGADAVGGIDGTADDVVGNGAEEDVGMEDVPERGPDKKAYSNRGTHTSTQL